MEADRDTRVALVRWTVIAAATDERLSPSERGRVVRELAARTHRDVDGQVRRYTTRTIYRWLKAWREGGFEGLKPRRRSDAGVARTDEKILGLAAGLRREAPGRSAGHIAEMIATTRGWEVSARTLQRFFVANGLERARLEGRQRAFGRFEAAACGDLWTTDAWDGPGLAELGGAHAQLFSILDDRSRLVAHAAFYPDVSERSFQDCLKTAIRKRGIPRRLYADRGSAYIAEQLRIICARLGIELVHSRPYKPQGRGKKERFYRTLAEQFAVEADLAAVDTLEQLNRFLVAWIERSYHRRTHSSTGQTPLERWMAGPSAMRAAPDLEALRRAFFWRHLRTVTATRTVSLHGNHYEVDPSLVGRRVELRYDPTDLTTIEVWDGDEHVGDAAPHEIRTHVDPKLRQQSPPAPGPATGIAYLETLAQDHADALRGGITYQHPEPDDHDDEERR